MSRKDRTRKILSRASELKFVYKPTKPRFVPDLSKLSESQRKMVLAARPDGIVHRIPYDPWAGSRWDKITGANQQKSKKALRKLKRRLEKQQRRQKFLDRKKHLPPKSPDAPRYSKFYLDYMASPEWVAKKKQVFALRGYICEYCKATNVRLDVHHLTYIRLGREKMEDLTITCRPCHQKAHKRIF